MLNTIPFLLFGGRHIRNTAPLALPRGQTGLARSGAEAGEDREEDESDHDDYFSNIDNGVEHYESEDNGSKKFWQ